MNYNHYSISNPKVVRPFVSFMVFTILLLFSSEVYSQTGSQEIIRILPTSTGEILDGIIPPRTCMIESGESGCYLVRILVPDHIEIDYTDDTKNAAIPRLDEILFIDQRENVYSVLIPSYLGAQIQIKNKDTGNILDYHRFPPDRNGVLVDLRMISQRAESAVQTRMSVAREPQRATVFEDMSGSVESVFNRDVPNRTVETESGIHGELIIETDVDAEIFINNEQVQQGSVNRLMHGSHTIELRHPLGNKEIIARVSAGHTTEVFESLLPRRSTAVTLSMLLPGAGQMYIGKERGPLYLIATAVGVAGTITSYNEWNDVSESVQLLQSDYNDARGLDQTRMARNELQNAFREEEEKYEVFTYWLAGTAAVYAISFLDILFSKPEYGYRDSRREAGVRISPTALSVGSQAIHPGVSLSLRW